MQRAAVLGCVLCAGLSAASQQPADSNLAARLQQIGTAAEALESKLPAFACRESLISQEVRGGKVKRQVQAEGDLRVLPQANGRMEEQFTATTINGKPAKPDKLHVPLFVRGGFREALSIFRPKDQRCFEFQLNGDHIEFRSRTEPIAGCADTSGMTGVAQLDGTGALTRLELRTDPDIAEARHAIPHAVLELTPVELAGTKFLLSTHVVAEHPNDRSIYRWEASYSSCRLFQATVKVGDATAISDDPGK